MGKGESGPGLKAPDRHAPDKVASTFPCSAATDSFAIFADVLESGASSFCLLGCVGRDVVRGDVTNLNRINPLLG